MFLKVEMVEKSLGQHIDWLGFRPDWKPASRPCFLYNILNQMHMGYYLLKCGKARSLTLSSNFPSPVTQILPDFTSSLGAV